MISINGKDICDSDFFEKYAGPAAIFSYKDGDVKIQKINKKYLHELGMNFEENEILSSNPWSNHDSQSKAAYETAIRRCIEIKKEVSVENWRELTSKCCGRESVCIKSNIQFLFEDNDEYFFYTIICNVTNDRRKLLEVQDSEMKFRAAAEQINVYAWEYDIKTKEMRPCIRCMRDLELPAVIENYPEPVFESGLFPMDFYDMYHDMLKKLEKGESEIDAIIPLTADRIPFHVRYTTEFDTDGNPIKAYGSAAAITEDEDFKKEYEQIVHALSTDYMNVFRVDVNTEMTKVIKWEGMVAYTAKEVEQKSYMYDLGIGLYLMNCVHPDDRENLSAALNIKQAVRMLTKNKEYTGTFRTLINGKTHHMMFKFFYIEDNTDVILAFQNIDDAVARQLDIEERLQNALCAAEKANNAKTTYLSRISHDIRTPLNGIIGLLEMIDRHRDDYMLMIDNNQKIKVAANHLLSLINDVLELGKIEDGNIVLAHELFNLNELNKDVVTIADMRACESGIKFEFDDSGCLGKNICIYGSPLHLRQIILNIIGNSIKYNKAGGSVRFSTSILEEESDKFLCRFVISDTGIGMKKEFLEHIFEPFSQERHDEKSISNGTGLGMAIVKALVDQMQGSITIDSEEGEGSTFTVDIPFERATEADFKDETINDEDIDLNGCNILFVEDNTINTIIGRNLLTDAGVNVVCVTDGKQALEKFTANAPGTFDVILMDVMMPVMDGLTATRKIRELDREDAKTIGIIAMTANAFEEDKKVAYEAGMNSYVTKPLDSKKLIREIALQIKK